MLSGTILVAYELRTIPVINGQFVSSSQDCEVQSLSKNKSLMKTVSGIEVVATKRSEGV